MNTNTCPAWCTDHDLDSAGVTVHRHIISAGPILVEVEATTSADTEPAAGIYVEVNDPEHRYPTGAMLIDPATAATIAEALTTAGWLIMNAASR